MGCAADMHPTFTAAKRWRIVECILSTRY